MAHRPARLALAGAALMAGAVACAQTVSAPLSQPTPVPTATPTTIAPTPSARPVVHVTPPPRLPLRVQLWGDSISAQAAPYISFFLESGGKAVAREHTFGGTALCDWFPDMRTELDPKNTTGFHPQAAVIQFSGDAFTPCMHDKNGVAYRGQALIDKYASDSAIAIALFRKAKIPVYFVSTPISRVQAAQGYVGNTPLGVMFSTLPSRFPAGNMVRFADAAVAVEWHGRYTDTLPCEKGEACTGRWTDGTRTVVVRQADGGHFCPVKEVAGNGGALTCPVPMPGARRFAIAIDRPILATSP